jgi:tyrosine-specific transport protein
MAPLVALVVSLLLLAGVVADDLADRPRLQEFLSKYKPFGSDASRTSADDYNKFIIPNFQHLKHGGGSDALSFQNRFNNPAEHVAGTDDSQYLDVNEDYGGIGASAADDRLVTIFHNQPAQTIALANEPMAFTSGKRETLNTEDSEPTKIDGKEFQKTVQNIIANSNTLSISFSAISVAFLSLATMLGLSPRRRELRSATVLTNSGGLASDMSASMALASGGNTLELPTKGSTMSSMAFATISAVQQVATAPVDSGEAPPAADMSDFSAAALIAGATVGAGILALPAATAGAGFNASTGVLCGSWLLMAIAGLLVAEAAAGAAKRTGDADVGFLAIVRELLGDVPACITGAIFAVYHYVLLVAYAGQGGGLLAGAVGIPAAAGALLFGSGVGGGVAFGPPKVVDKANGAFCAVVAASFVVLLITGAPAFDAGRLAADGTAKAALDAVPISALSLCYHTVIPTVSRRLGYDRSRIARAVLFGSACPLVMFIAWNALVLGAVPSGLEAADPVAALIAGQGEAGATLAMAVQIFSFSAVVNTFCGVYHGMRGYVKDVFVESSARMAADDERILAAAVLVPPLFLAATNPTLFLPALDAGGTFGIPLLFGIVPAACVWRLRQNEASSDVVFVPGGDAVLAAVAVISLLIIGKGTLDGFGLI